jgi:alpha-tubulin suppressor-like RCC1 family protein
VSESSRWAFAILIAAGCGGSTTTETIASECPNDAGTIEAGFGGASREAESDGSHQATSDVSSSDLDSSANHEDAKSDESAGDAISADHMVEPSDASARICPTPPSDQRVLQVAVGGGRSCAILSGGVLKCWGYIGSFLGIGSDSPHGTAPNTMGDKLPPVDLGTGKTAIQVSVGYTHTCVLLNDGKVKCFGGNYYGQLGLGDTMERGEAPNEMGDHLPGVDLGTGKTAVAVAAGYGQSCAVLNDGSVKCWGGGEWGALGLGDSIDRGGKPGQMGDNLPAVDLGTGKTAIAINAGSGSAAYYDHTCAVLRDGGLKCWGSNVEGELGQGDRTFRGNKPNQMGDNLPPIDLGTGRTAVMVSAGYVFTCAVLDDHSVKCWGSGDETGLGRIDNRGEQPGQMGDQLPAVDLGTGAKAVAVGAGYTSACALLADGRVKCWGGGPLGLGDSLPRGSKPRQMGDYLPAVDFGACQSAQVALGTATSGGSSASCVLLANGTVKCWGAGGLLGLGDNMSRGDMPGQMGDNLPTVKLFSDVW